MKSPRQTRCWRVFYTMARNEKRCEERLAGEQIEVFLPKRVVWRQWKDRKKKVVEPLFSNYIFAYVDEGERLRVLQTEGIVRCVSFGARLAEVTKDEIAQLRITQQDPERIHAVDFPLPQRGTQVTITEGPMRGLRGEVVEHRGEQHIVIRISAIRQAIRVNLPAEWVYLVAE